MKLLRVQVPNFRALKDVDISFEPDFVPNIFPIGSQNGGGKSTLLQLIFILLHCSHHPDRKSYIKTLLKSFRFAEISDDYELATITLEHRRNFFRLEFFCMSDDHPEVNHIIREEGNFVIVDFSKDGSSAISHLICRVWEGIDPNDRPVKEDKILPLLKELSEKVFLALPETPIFLFLDRTVNRQLLQSNLGQLPSDVYGVTGQLPGLFLYKFLAVDSLLGIFKDMRDLDFQKAIETKDYGTNYREFLSDLNQFFGGTKLVNIVSSDLNEVNFYRTEEGIQRALIEPADLSRGEMKRLSMYIWLRRYQIQDAVVLVDEIEEALHPDWQYQIVSDLATWGPTNQYLLATHSYELCQALTPAHVKEIPPVLLKQPVANP
jgi:AAA domain, putative AbiEii toxin, Type IV TA system/AAA ATPase domain